MAKKQNITKNKDNPYLLGFVILEIIVGVLITFFMMLSYNQLITQSIKTAQLQFMAYGILFVISYFVIKEPIVKYVSFAMALLILTTSTPISVLPIGKNILPTADSMVNINTVLAISAGLIFTAGQYFVEKNLEKAQKNYFALAAILTIAVSIVSLTDLGYSAYFSAFYMMNLAIFLVYLSFGLLLAQYEYSKEKIRDEHA